jgi:flagellar operon protein
MTVRAVGIAPEIAPSQRTNKTQGDQAGVGFNKILDSTLNFSKHVADRIGRRQLDMSAEKLRQLEGAVDKAAAKGAKESLVLLENLAVLVSVNNRTVITAMDKNNMKEGVFTQIDSAIIV